MKTVVSFLLISAAFVTAIISVQQPLGEKDDSSSISNVILLSRAQVISELEVAKAIGRLISSESEDYRLSGVNEGGDRERTLATHTNDSYAFENMDYKSAFSATHVPRG